MRLAVADKGFSRAQIQRDRRRFAHSRRAEQTYASQLRQIARQVGMLVKGYAPDGIVIDSVGLRRALHDYADLIAPWARRVAERMINEVGNRDLQGWESLGAQIGRNLRLELASTSVGEQVRELLALQVDLITSIPRDAAERVHKLTMEALSNSQRAPAIAAEILRSNEVSKSRAVLIARTETGRMATVFTQARAQHLGSEGYIWRTAHDHDVRESHKKMEGRFVRWDTPPTLSDGTVTHAGAIYNCRCFPEPVLPEIIA